MLQSNQSSPQQLYAELQDAQYSERPYERRDLGEQMEIIKESIYGWWKPRFLVDHRARCAYEFMLPNFRLQTVTDEDINWYSLRKLPEAIVARAKEKDAFYPTVVRVYENDTAEMIWQLNPDGRYFMDEDGYGMTDDEEVALVGRVDRTGRVVEKLKYKKG